MLTANTSRFEITDVQFTQRHDSTIRGEPSATDVVASLRVACGVCGNNWTAFAGDGSLYRVIGGVRVCCGRCGNDETITTQELEVPF